MHFSARDVDSPSLLDDVPLPLSRRLKRGTTMPHIDVKAEPLLPSLVSPSEEEEFRDFASSTWKAISIEQARGCTSGIV